MNSVTVMAMVLIGVCCIMLATQPTRSISRRGRRDRAKSRKDDPHSDPTPANARHGAAPPKHPSSPRPAHRNRWDRADLERAFGQDLDTPDPDDTLWPLRSTCWR